MAQEKARAPRARTKKDTTAADLEAPAPKRRARRTTQAATEPEQVATLAYLIWERGEPGDALEHWLRAERELAA